MNLRRVWRKLASILIILFLCTLCCNSISIDNDILGEPDIECLDQEIRVWVKTRKPFQGRIYAKGKSDDPACSKDDFLTKKLKKAHFDLGLGMCGMKSLRSYDPRGMYYGITLVISFHPLFITKVDQAFHVKCFFEEANRGLTAELGVSMIPTTEVMARHGIPGCTYSIHRSSIDELDAGKAAGTPIQFAKVGDKVLHQWHCDDQMFGILINNCYVTDGVNKKADVIDSHGCPVDPILITGIRYSADLQRAYAESQVFKFADRPGVWFFCQIQMCMKKEGMCDNITPPSCATTNAPPRGGSSGGNTTSPKSANYRTRIASRVTTNEEYVETVENTSSTEHDGINNTLDPDVRDYDQSTSGGKITRPKHHQNVHEYDAQPVATAANDEDYEPSAKSEYTTKASPASYGVARSRKGLQKLREAQPSASGYGGYGPPAAPPNLIHEYDSEVNEGETKAATTVFGPAYSPELAGPYGLPPLSPIIDPNRNLPGIGRDPPAALANGNYGGSYSSYAGATSSPQNEGKQRQEVSTEFETNDQLGPSPPPGTATTSASASNPTPTQRGTGSTGPSPINTSNNNNNQRETRVKKDYVDYDSDVTIPPNLNDLLANLEPQEINAQNLQRLFRDSVADRRALLQGFDVLVNKMKRENVDEHLKHQDQRRRLNQRRGPPSVTPSPSERRPPSITPMPSDEPKTDIPTHRTLDRLKPGDKVDTIQVTLDSDSQSRTARDLPIQGTSGKRPSAQTLINPQNFLSLPTGQNAGGIGAHFDANGAPMIGGQLLIYDLDETPPPDPAKSAKDPTAEGDCAVTRHGLLVLMVTTGSVTAAFFCLTLALCARLRHSERCRRRAESSLIDTSSARNESMDSRSPRNSTSSASSFSSSSSSTGPIKQRRPPEHADVSEKKRKNISQHHSTTSYSRPSSHSQPRTQNCKVSF